MNFIVLEGIDGTGKGTIMEKVVDHFVSKLGHDQVVVTKDPGGTPLGTEIRKILYESVGTKNLSLGVVDLLFLASHLQNWQTVVEPALAAGKIVISDRWHYSQMAYSTQRPVPTAIYRAYDECKGKPADLLIFLHGDVETVLERARRRTDGIQQAKAWNERYTLDQVQKFYFTLFSKKPEWRPVCVDGKTPDEVWSEVKEILEQCQTVDAQ